MQPKLPLPPGLRRRKNFLVGEHWYVANVNEGLTLVEIVSVTHELIIFNAANKINNDSLPVQSPLFLSLPEYLWLKKMIIRAKQINSKSYMEAIINNVHAGNAEYTVFVDWLHRVQKKICMHLSPEATASVIEKLLAKIH